MFDDGQSRIQSGNSSEAEETKASGVSVMAKKRRAKRVCETVDELPAACPRCGSTDRTQKECQVDVSKHLDRPICGTIHGKPYNRVVWSYATCRECDTRYRIRTFHLSTFASDV